MAMTMKDISSERKDEIITGLIGKLDYELYEEYGCKEIAGCLNDVMSKAEEKAYISEKAYDRIFNGTD